jgi:RimJ/RimL family protein N-acetyltransferase
MKLSSLRLRYEPLSPPHAPLLHASLSPPEVWQHIGPSQAETVAALTQRFARMAAGPEPPCAGERWENFAVRLGDGDYCGVVESTIYTAANDDGWAEIAYLIGPPHWGRGLGTEAVAWLCARLHEAHGIDELWAATRPENIGSRRVLEKVGFSEVPSSPRALGSYDPGDLLFRRG